MAQKLKEENRQEMAEKVIQDLFDKLKKYSPAKGEAEKDYIGKAPLLWNNSSPREFLRAFVKDEGSTFKLVDVETPYKAAELCDMVCSDLNKAMRMLGTEARIDYKHFSYTYPSASWPHGGEYIYVYIGRKSYEKERERIDKYLKNTPKIKVPFPSP